MRFSQRWMMRDARSIRTSLNSRRMRTSLIAFTAVPAPPPDAHSDPKSVGAKMVIESKGRTVATSY